MYKGVSKVALNTLMVKEIKGNSVCVCSQAEAHYKGSKHAKKLKAQESTKNKQKGSGGGSSGGGAPESGAKPASTGPVPSSTDSSTDQTG
ncbi:hypothetical protein NFI96_007789 [Prochilodus magdalenae]|nr:hypothetical protein NFI96_007789 [Prochilodus magdalenae]